MYEGDTAQDLAEKFCQEHDLDEETQKNLEALLEQQIASVLTKIDENEEDAESYETSNWLWEREVYSFLNYSTVYFYFCAVSINFDHFT